MSSIDLTNIQFRAFQYEDYEEDEEAFEPPVFDNKPDTTTGPFSLDLCAIKFRAWQEEDTDEEEEEE